VTGTNPNAFTSFVPSTGGSYAGIVAFNAGTSTAGSAPVLTPANTNGVAAQLTDHARDYMVYLTIGTAGTALTVLIGPTASPANTIYTAATATAGEAISFRLPAGWFWEWAATTATLAEQFAVGC
jgi:hypothetical protein